LEGLDVEVVEGDLADADLLNRATRGCEAVIHSAAFIHIGWTRLSESRQVNVEGTRHLVEACLSHGLKMVHVSTVDTFPAAASMATPVDELTSAGVSKVPCSYVISKREADEVVRCAVRKHQLRATIIHPGFMLGPFDWKPSSGRLMLGVVKAPLAIAPSGGCSLCDPRDVASAIVKAVDRGREGESYITAGENMTYRELWRRILATAGRKRNVYSPSLVLSLTGWVTDSVVKILALKEGDINGAAIAMGRLFHYYNSAKAQQELDYQVRPWEASLTDAWRWLCRRAT